MKASKQHGGEQRDFGGAWIRNRKAIIYLLPDALRTDFADLIQHNKIPTEHLEIIKAADKISAYLKCQTELKAGNTEFVNAAEQIALSISESTRPEVIFFMQSFVPSCALTLDGLMQTN